MKAAFPPPLRDQVADFVQVFKDHPMVDLIADAETRMEQVIVGDQTYPATVTAPKTEGNCYLCCPTTAYIDYAIAEVQSQQMPALAKSAMCAAIRACTPLVRAAGLDRQVQVNNWMVSTNPAPEFEPDKIVRSCLATYPDSAIVIRSLNDVWDQDAIDALQAVGFRMLAARQVYLVPTGDARLPRDVKRDAKVLANSELELVDGHDLTPKEFDRCVSLYRALYLEKYTDLNPHYTATFLREMQARHLMTVLALRDPKDGIVGFTVLFECNGTLTQPLVGYDTARPQSEGLYRMVMHLGRRHAQAHNLNFNLSAGAAGFKRNRGAIAAVEYTAVYVAHLSWKMRAATAILEFISTKIGVPLVKRFEA